MSFQTRKSNRALEQAEIRAACLAAIDPHLDLGNDRNLDSFNLQISELQEQINHYNTTVAELQNVRSNIKDREKTLREFSSQMLLGVAFTYGKDSLEYELAGGVRKSEQIRRNRLARMKHTAEEELVN